MKKWIVPILAVIFLILIVAAILFPDLPYQLKIIQRAPPKLSMTINPELEEILTGWIYQASNRISLRTAREIAHEAIKTEIPLYMIGLINAESEFVPTAVSSKGAIGLTQVMFEVHGKELIRVGLIKDKRDLFDIGPSVRSGHFIFNMYLKQSRGDVEKATELYLGGKDGAYMKKISLTLANLYIRSAQKRKGG
jgi:hypothetical protein